MGAPAGGSWQKRYHSWRKIARNLAFARAAGLSAKRSGAKQENRNDS